MIGGAATGSSTKKSSKVMNISQDNINFNTFDANSNAPRIALQKVQPEEARKVSQNNPKNYSM